MTCYSSAALLFFAEENAARVYTSFIRERTRDSQYLLASGPPAGRCPGSPAMTPCLPEQLASVAGVAPLPQQNHLSGSFGYGG